MVKQMWLMHVVHGVDDVGWSTAKVASLHRR